MILVDFTILTFADPSPVPGDPNVKINPLKNRLAKAKSLDNGARYEQRTKARIIKDDWARSSEPSIATYNHRRLHSLLEYASPMAFERKWLAWQTSLSE